MWRSGSTHFPPAAAGARSWEVGDATSRPVAVANSFREMRYTGWCLSSLSGPSHSRTAAEGSSSSAPTPRRIAVSFPRLACAARARYRED
ncbi:hypothetical protein GQ53DRAFT_754423 [Thozetella sp. PMI_491]|nr:hypothetical protein GQ53DRAFT_754423 [Thozetella sp. PMI_491]